MQKIQTVEEWLGHDNQIGIDIWNKKYRDGNENFEQWVDRVSAGDSDIAALILDKKFLFGGRILSNRGRSDIKDRKVTMSNCYVTSVEDSIESIFETSKKIARTLSTGGGIGVDVSTLAPRGAKIRNAAETTTGIVPFMDIFSQVVGSIGAEGRRGALMISLSCDHPDIEEFINVKTNLGRVEYANISLRITNAFMEAAKVGADFTLSFTRPETGETVTKVVNAKDMLRKFAEANWDYAEPGMLFWDRIERWNLVSQNSEFKYAGTNPCGEEPLQSGGACLLGSINLSEYVVNPFTSDALVDYDALFRDAVVCTNALNIVLDEGIHLHPLEEQRQNARDWRPIGLGIMGLADMLIKLGLQYGSAEAQESCGFAMKTILIGALHASSLLAEQLGAYHNYNGRAISEEFYVRLESMAGASVMRSITDRIRKNGLRNAQLLTIAPTGSISTMLGISGGAEPIFANSYTRLTKSLHGEDIYYKVYHPTVMQYMSQHGVADEDGLPDYFVSARDIHYRDRIDMQAALQEYIDAAISSTINLPESTSVEEVVDLYTYAWEKGLKGVTVFREGCKRFPVLSVDDKAIGSEPLNLAPTTSDYELTRGTIIDVSDDVIGMKRKLTTGCGTLHCLAFFDPITGDLLETYLNKGSDGGCNNSLTGMSRMISLACRAGVPLSDIVDQLKSTGVCAAYAVRRSTRGDTSRGSCCPVAVANALQEMHDGVSSLLFDDETCSPDDIPHCATDTQEDRGIRLAINTAKATCPECGDTVAHEGGCDICKSCGWSKCS